MPGPTEFEIFSETEGDLLPDDFEVLPSVGVSVGCWREKNLPDVQLHQLLLCC